MSETNEAFKLTGWREENDSLRREVAELRRELADAMDAGRTLAAECERFRVEGNAEIERLEGECERMREALIEARRWVQSTVHDTFNETEEVEGEDLLARIDTALSKGAPS